MNERGQYGDRTRLLRGGSLYSSPPWGGAPDETLYGWPYRGPRAFHGHEAPTFGRRGSWPPRREAPLGRGGLVVGENERGQYGDESVNVGFIGLPIAAALYVFSHHGDEDAAVEQINTEFDTLNSELLALMGVDPAEQQLDYQAWARDPVGYAKRLATHQAAKEKSSIYPFYRDVFDPKYRLWRKFYTDQSRSTQFWTSWNEYEQWRTHVMNLRAGAKRLGVSLRSADPLPFGKTLLQKAADLPGQIAKPFGEAWDLVKVGLYGALGIGAVIALASVWSNVKKGQDPVEKYFALAGRGTRAT